MIPTADDGDRRNCFELILNYNCNARCLFCSQGDFSRSLNADLRQILRDIVRGKRSGYKRLGLTGGEPLVRGDVLRIVAFARAAGFPFIRVQTNGIRLADRGFAEALVRAGVTYVKFSLHSRHADIHDRLLGVPGAWRKAMAGLEHLKDLKVRIGINTVLNRDNYADLPEFLRFYLKQGVSDFVVIYPIYTGNMLRNRRRMGIPLSKATPAVLESLELVANLGMDRTLLLLNVPPCFVPGYETQVIGTDRFNTVVTDPQGRRWDLDLNRDQGKVKGDVCRDCSFGSRCLGVDRGYIETWGWRGFRPIRSSLPSLGRGSEASQAMTRRARKRQRAGRRTLEGVEILTDNERCLLEVLRRQSPVSTRRVLELAKDIPLCRDCSDANAVLNAGERLVEAGKVRREFRDGHYLWGLAL